VVSIRSEHGRRRSVDLLSHGLIVRPCLDSSRSGPSPRQHQNRAARHLYPPQNRCRSAALRAWRQFNLR